jgi:putative membrane protein
MQQEHEHDRTRPGWAIAIIIGAALVITLAAGMIGWGLMRPGFMSPGLIPFFGPGMRPWWGIVLGIGLLLRALMIGGIVLLVIWGIRRTGPRIGAGRGSSSALAILQERYAKGEITREQYEQLRADLNE